MVEGSTTPGNPFTYGNPISDPTRFFGRQREVGQIFSRLQNEEFESSSIVGDRRVGKTSLLLHLAHPEVLQAHGLAGAAHSFVYVDLQMVDAGVTPQRLWAHLLLQLQRRCSDGEIKDLLRSAAGADPIDTFALDEVFTALDEHGHQVVFLLDEFEHVTQNENFGPDFFYGLRSLAIHHRLALITSSRRELIELCHSERIRSSPFFNIFAQIGVRLFTRQEADDLIATSLAGTGVAFLEDERAAVFDIAGCHPYFVQAACHFLFEAHRDERDRDARLRVLLARFREEATPHLDDYWRNSDDAEKIVLTAIALLERNGKAGARSFGVERLRELYARSEHILSRLERRGLLLSDSEGYSLFSAALGGWIVNEITAALAEQQTYPEWLASHSNLVSRLESGAKRELEKILPKVGSR